MPAPDLIPIAREAGYRTDTIGRYADGQFYAAVHGARRDDDHEPDMGRERIRWYATISGWSTARTHLLIDQTGTSTTKPSSQTCGQASARGAKGSRLTAVSPNTVRGDPDALTAAVEDVAYLPGVGG